MNQTSTMQSFYYRKFSAVLLAKFLFLYKTVFTDQGSLSYGDTGSASSTDQTGPRLCDFGAVPDMWITKKQSWVMW